EAEHVRALASPGRLHLQLLVALIAGALAVIGAVALQGDALPHAGGVARRGVVGRHRALAAGKGVGGEVVLGGVSPLHPLAHAAGRQRREEEAKPAGELIGERPRPVWRERTEAAGAAERGGPPRASRRRDRIGR